MLSIDTELNKKKSFNYPIYSENKSSPIPIKMQQDDNLTRVSSEIFNPNFSSSPPENSFMRKLEERFKNIN
tara:strand:- start:869 stop:1081 length:213 start_codon:yes stop_codon:yes gene_type:complete